LRNALIISLALHLVVGLMWARIVKISRVRFIPTDVYTVTLVTPTLAAQPKPEKIEVTPEPAPPKPDPVEEEEDEMPPPPEKPKPKPVEKEKVVKKIIPTTDTQNNVEPDPATDPDQGEDVVTGDIMLDGQDFPFAYYLATMRRKVATYWQVPGSSESDPKYCRVHFRVTRDGSIQSPSIETSSGNFLFDQAALRAVVQASPLPPLPSGFADNYLAVHFSFAFEKE